MICVPRWSLLALAATLLLAMSPGVSARAAADLDRELGEVARGIKRLLDGRNQDAVAVGEFTGPARALASGGAGIKQALIEQLQKHGVRVERRAELEVKGDYLDVLDQQTKLLALQLQARVLDRSGNEVTKFKRGLFNVATIAALLGTTVQIPPGASEEAREKALREGVDDPHPQVGGSRIAAGPGSPYAVAVLVKAGDRFEPRAARLEDGLAFVPLKRDEVYAIQLINGSSHEAAVTLTIDGLSVFAFSQVKDARTGRPRYTHVIVPAHGTGLVPGWHVTDESTDSFLITSYARSAAAELRSGGDVGTVTASFAAAWPKGSAPPADEAGRAGRLKARTADATGRGPRIDYTYQPVERELGHVRATISVRYTK